MCTMIPHFVAEALIGVSSNVGLLHYNNYINDILILKIKDQ